MRLSFVLSVLTIISLVLAQVPSTPVPYTDPPSVEDLDTPMCGNDVNNTALINAEENALNYTVGGGSSMLRSDGPAKIRISFDLSSNTDPTEVCQAPYTSDAPEIPNPFGEVRGSTIACGTDDGIYAANVAHLKHILLPYAYDQIQHLINVTNPLTQTPPVTQSNVERHVCGLYKWNVPSEVVDLVVKVVVLPRRGNMLKASGAGMPCSYTEEGRPSSGIIFIAPDQTHPWGPITEEHQRRKHVQKALVLHELFHVLGWLGSYIRSSRFDDSPTERIVVNHQNGHNVFYLQTPEVTKAAQKYFNCSTLQGLELAQSDANLNSMHSHPSRAKLFDDVMSLMPGPKYISSVSLALFRDCKKHYRVTDDPEVLASTKNVRWGRNAGCSFTSNASEPCNTTGGGMGKYFCKDQTNQPACSADLRSIGICQLTTNCNVPKWQRHYFPPAVGLVGVVDFMDGCPIVSSTTSCRWPRGSSEAEAKEGYTFGAGSMCYTADTTVMNTPSSTTSRCFVSRCLEDEEGNRRVEILFSGFGWQRCPMDGSEGPAVLDPKIHGGVTCHSADTVCAVVPPIQVTPAPPPTPVPPTPAPPEQCGKRCSTQQLDSCASNSICRRCVPDAAGSSSGVCSPGVTCNQPCGSNKDCVSCNLCTECHSYNNTKTCKTPLCVPCARHGDCASRCCGKPPGFSYKVCYPLAPTPNPCKAGFHLNGTIFSP